MQMSIVLTENSLLLNSLEWDMILKKEKWVVFQNEISEEVKQGLYELYPNSKGFYAPNTFYLKNSETGELLGEATSYLVYYLLYDVEKGYHANEIVKARNDALKDIYYEWCFRKSLNFNPNEGWTKSKKFSKYLNQIGWGSSNYVVFINDVIQY